jgi:UTP--glucose-1-phosphate uridylyltransferase
MTSESSARFAPFEETMLRAGVQRLAIDAFRSAYSQLAAGGTGLIPRATIDPVDHVTDLEQWADKGAGDASILASTAVIKLNGGLGTSMGLERAKSLIEVKNGLTFLDITARQLLSYKSRFGIAIPLLLMNSYNTDADSMAALENYPALVSDIPLRFLQHRVPKVDARDLRPVRWKAQPDLEWCPPGHGDIYAALVTSGVLPSLLARGIRYAFVSNIDNLGAVLDARIPLYMREQGIDFLMEVADRTLSDRKGGHLARGKDGRLLLREAAQCPADEMENFQNITEHRYFNTNSLWIDLAALARTLESNDGILPLPLIRNAKTVDPRDPSSPPVYQLETAMGSAISLFDRAAAVRVPRSRFAPVKTTDDLLGLWSDAFVLTSAFQIVPHPDRRGDAPAVTLDPKYYRFIRSLREHFPHGAPSLLQCGSFVVDGDATFGANVAVRGNVHVAVPEGEQRSIPDGTIFEQ